MATPTKWGNEFLVNTTTDNRQTDLQLSALADGRFVATWMDRSGTLGDSGWAIDAQMFSADGTKAGTEFRVNTTTSGDQSDAGVTGLPDGRFVVVWTDLSGGPLNPDIRGQIFNPDGTPSGSEFVANMFKAEEMEAGGASITPLSGGRFIVAWTVDKGAAYSADVRAQIFNPDGTRSGEFVVNTLTSLDESRPSMTGLADGRFVATWNSYDGGSVLRIHAQIFDEDGSKSSPEFLVGSPNVSAGRGGSVTALADGFVIVWSDFAGASEDIRAQVYDANGATSGPAFLVNTTTVGLQVYPTIAALPDGRFVAAWNDLSMTGADSSSLAIRAQVFNPNGKTSGAEFLVNTATHGDQFSPTIAVLADGRFVIGWSDNGETGADQSDLAVRAQIFDPRESAVHLQGGALNDDWVGTKFGDTMKGGGGADRLDGAGGIDSLIGGAGNDIYIVDNFGDLVTENPNEGTDTIVASTSYVLPSNVENLTLSPGATSGTGNDLDNVMIGNDASNVLNGLNGNDTLEGRGGADVLVGGAGDDTAVFSHSLAQASVYDYGDKIFVWGPDGLDTLTGIEHLQFTDGTVTPQDGNALFDTLYYMIHNIDVFHAGVNALDHFNAAGWHEGRDPNAFFSVNGYLAANPDVKASGMNPLDHYHQAGWHEGRDPGANFDTTLYLIHNPDVAAAGIDPLTHFLQVGFSEGRQAYQAIGSTIVNGFDAEYYLFHNPDVAAAGVDPLAHFQQFGWHEGRNPNAYFDTAGYLSHYTDVAAAGVNPLDHYEAFGWKEGRDASRGFDTNGYLAANPDVAAAQVNPLDHFLHNGIYEGRMAINDGLWH